MFFILLCFKLTMVINQCLGVDHDGILLLFSPFPIIPIVGKGGFAIGDADHDGVACFRLPDINYTLAIHSALISKATVCRTVHRVAGTFH